MRLERAVAVVQVAAVSVFAVRGAQAQCAMCRSTLASPEGQQLAAGLRNGIGILVAAPFIVVAAVAWAAWRVHRQLRP